MNIAGYAINNKQVINFFLILTLFGGIFAFDKLGKREDAPFVIKEAIFMTFYPGASQYEVEEQVTEIIERELQSHPLVDWIKSESKPGFSYIKVSMYQYIPKEEFQQLWDELRRKALNVQSQLPKEASTILVNDDFGDVFGIYYALTADEGFTYEELEDYAQFIKQNLATVKDAAKVELFGIQDRVVNVYISEQKLSNSGITPANIREAINSQNQLVKAGNFKAGKMEVRVDAVGTFQSLEEIENLVITGREGNQIRLQDLATVERDYKDPPGNLMRMNGKPAIGIGIATRVGGNSVKMGERVRTKLEALEALLPIGIELNGIYFEDEVAVKANNDFLVNLALAVGIVIFIILLSMGVRAGLLIGSSLIFTIMGTLLFMMPAGIELHRTSLAAIIIAMGMLVDNAIVVTDNAQIRIKRGMKRRDALVQGATTPQWGLFGATIIAVISFLPLYLAPNNTAEIIKPLFVVLAISLLLSWLFALIQTPVWGDFILKETKGEEGKDPYDTAFYRKLTGFIEGVIKMRWITLGAVVVLFVISMSLFKFIEEDFFPAINKAEFKMDYFLPQGSDIKALESDIKEMEDFLLSREDVQNVSISLGAAPLRYYLATVAWSPRPHYANLLIETNDFSSADSLMGIFKNYVESNFPDGLSIFYKFKVSPYPDAILEATFQGPDEKVLRNLANQAKEIMRADPLVENVRDGWGERTLKFEPLYSQNKGRIANVTRTEMASALQRVTDGQQVGTYREKDWVMPILLKDVNYDYYDYSNIGGLPIMSSTGETVPLEQITDGLDMSWEEGVITKYNRELCLAAQCDPVPGVGNKEIESRLMHLIEDIPLPPGYSLWWDGIYEDQTLSSEAIMSQMPIAIILILSILMLLFRDIRKTLIVILMVPLVLIGVVFAFLTSGLFFGFFAILGLLGLVGMVIKNAIVLLDQAELEMKENGKSKYQSIVLAARSRAIPVSMAAGTTILGMIPLVPDPMFGGMAVTIMGGLFVATLLTIIVLPAFYAIIFGLKREEL
ncbi:MAG TPA: efflux RND transporter permease subunit [Bacteroides sp.]|nr:efflux RND transporter permease subunit [Bacteroides sp.]